MRKIVLFLAKALALLLIALWFIDPKIQVRAKNRCTIHLVDVSKSILKPHTDTVKAINYLVQNSDQGDLHGVFAFAKGLKQISEISSRPVIEQIRPSLDQGDSDLLSAIQTLSLLYPDGFSRQLIIYSDGNVNDLENISALSEKNRISVSLFPTGLWKPADVRIVSVDCPRFVDENAKAVAQVNMWSNVEKKVTVRLSSADRQDSKEISLVADTMSSVQFEIGPVNYTHRIFKAEVAEHDDCVQNNVFEFAIYRKTAKLDMVIVTGFQKSPIYNLLKGIAAYSIRVQRDLKPEELANVAVVVLENCEIKKEFDMPLASFVRSGGGLLILGGDKSYGLGNMYQTEVEKISPLHACPDERETIVFALDKSGSMNQPITMTSTRKKIDFAIDAIRQSLAALHRSDYVGVIAFDSVTRVLSDLVTGDNIPELKVTANGSTNIIPAIDKALDMLSSVAVTSRRHIILITDGESEEEKELFDQMGKKTREKGVRLSIISTQKDKFGKLGMLGGSLHETLEFTKIEKLIKDIVASSKELYVRSVELKPSSHNLMNGIKLPQKIGCVNRTSPKKTSHVILDSEQGPICAFWEVESGKAMAATYSLQKGWGEELAVSEDFGRFISRAIQFVKANERRVLNAQIYRGMLLLSGEGLPGELAQCNGTLTNSKTGESTAAVFSRDGLYTLTTGVNLTEGVYYVIAGGWISTFSVPYSSEYKKTGIDLKALSRLGSVVLDLEKAKPSTEEGVTSARTLLLLGALFFFLADLVISALWK